MVKVVAQGKTIECELGANLRRVLLTSEVDLYNGNAKAINCHGIGSCAPCAVLVEGEVSQPNWRDKARRSLPPHSPTRRLRLACPPQILGDVKVTFDGFWGQGTQSVWTAKA